MALDPEIAAVLESLRGTPPLESLSVAGMRASMLPVPLSLRPAVAATTDEFISPHLRARIYRPLEPLLELLIIYFHGGGFVLGSLDTHDHVCRQLCASVGCAVMAVDYRLAPEHPFPAATDDCLAAARWTVTRPDLFGAALENIVLGGDSAGATLATVTTLRIRDEGGPRLRGQVLAYPVTDYHSPPTRSYLDNASGYSLTRAAMIRFWDEYVTDPQQALHPHASPLRAPDLSGLPPTLILTAEFDPLRDEGEAYAAKLRQDGNQTTLLRYEGLIHGFIRMAAVSKRSRDAFTDIATWIATLPLSSQRIG